MVRSAALHDHLPTAARFGLSGFGFYSPFALRRDGSCPAQEMNRLLGLLSRGLRVNGAICVVCIVIRPKGSRVAGLRRRNPFWEKNEFLRLFQKLSFYLLHENIVHRI